METKVKEIIASFIGKDAPGISAETSLDRNALKSSIHVHRMYARLASEGFPVVDYSDVKNFADLMRKLHPSGLGEATKDIEQGISFGHVPNFFTPGVGIDIEEVALLPQTTDYRTHEFFINNFTPEEISHCILQSNPRASFAGLFAVKEAMVKADNKMGNRAFNTISIQHTKNGKPVYSDMDISISHAAGIAVAVAIQKPINFIEKTKQSEKVKSTNNAYFALIIAIFALVIGIIALTIQFRNS